MILQPPLERGPRGRALRDPRATLGTGRGLDAREPLRKHFLSEENMATHFSRLSLHNDHPYCSPPVALPPALPPVRSPSSEVLLWRYPGNLIPEALRLLRLGDPPAPSSPAAPTGDGREP
ncbi:host cell factor C1 regulator 1-like isoform X2 [Ochotona curzoniae]|uniref:host cell factor C1 regulator 1-like isoform X2 n=1 Tax=Ochotona curzoniae TaxID=130825 RepID=UPI001B346CC4|nr:host cell factor C1 regulator 1-like isoform X2 [Ochotona curzoniae]XP_040853549.1 host cell factor C1 regulator 1-like isoform X2 [Ochotona curzoniae]